MSLKPGFHATTALVSAVFQAATKSASEIFTVLMSDSFMPALLSARLSR